MSNEGEGRRTPIIFTAIILTMLVMSLIALFLAVGTYLSHKTIDVINVILSVSAISLSIYLLIQMRRKRTLFQNSDNLRVITVIKCASCDYNSSREFEKGDYILREVGSCPKCSGTLLVYSIFRESQEGKKEKF
ncbi:MAG: hypothetical protein QW145_05355 [Candidatus Bathyarchaeia archaeon]